MTKKYTKAPSSNKDSVNLDDIQLGLSPTKNIIAAIVALIFVISTGYLAFSYFQNISPDNQNGSDNESEVVINQNEKDESQEQEGRLGFFRRTGEIISGSTQRFFEDTTYESDNEEGTTSETEILYENVAGEQNERSESIDENSNNFYIENWEARDYNPGDLEAGSHTVQQGDTLWEIAEAAYGDGSMWTLIRDANTSSIGFLGNGQQALITPSQVLVIPAI